MPPLHNQSSINNTLEVYIASISFHVEQTAYPALKAYLMDLKRCFPEDSMTIEDIETRMAEVLLERLSIDKGTIDKNDVELMVLQVGTAKEIALAEGIDLDLGYFERKEQWQPLKKAEPKRELRNINKKFSLQKRDKKIGGVASGIADYYNIDPVFVRLGFIGSVLAGGFGIPLYGAAWLAMPKDPKEGIIEEQKSTSLIGKTKRFMRSMVDKKIAGVASGIAKYFGIDETIVRLLFIGGFFLKGFGLLAYLALWIAMPKVKSLEEQIDLEEKPSFLEEENFKTRMANVENQFDDTVSSTASKVKNSKFFKKHF
ncbi:putative stress-responsive transcriptional regulator [Bernardetia litoralis DSM 6794]|uniref:Putative stress-responsive transcriptional regulator n=1 Tax=Bernardetia litoralis (strain ATCC 23117 / DSM 6794 / NBRC 15988 / NCIMB 1366 / Fx l1 / Sio-4) TaxID=880071 RepID=I4AN10_BERLS|nr:PspC domain-containing protein [Bernardetia litoralis]AFM05345.1 putative stress-responsive transcriptional regulator [Bernardetia litoralis DSM 6794]